MSLVRLADDGEISDVDRTVADSGREQYGQLLSTWRATLRRPGLFAAYLPFLRAVAAPGAVDVGLKDAAALLVAHLNNCAYTVSHRYASARRNGVADDVLARVVAGEWDGFDESWRVALEFTRQLTLAPAEVPWGADPQAVAAPVRDRLVELFDDEQVVELSMSASVWNALARFHRVLDLPFDMPHAPDGIAPR